jgi:hypothetical protein
MRLPPERPTSLALSFALIRAVARIVPAAEQGQFVYDWQQKLFHRWMFLREAGLWNVTEEFKLLKGALPCVPAAVQHFGARQEVRSRVSQVIQSPITCLSVVMALLLLIAIGSGGLPATRDLFFKQVDSGATRRVYVWSHNLRGGGDRPIPADVVAAWKTHSHLIASGAAFRAVHRDVQIGGGPMAHRLVVITEPSFFAVTGIQPLTGAVPDDTADYMLLSYKAWMEQVIRLGEVHRLEQVYRFDQFHASPRVQGSSLTIEHKTYPILGVLPPDFEPLSRQAAIYLVQRHYREQDAYAVVRANPGVTQRALDKEFLDIAQNVTYYFLNGQLRFGFAQSANWSPVRSFGFAILASVLMLLVVFRMKWRMLWPQASHRHAFLRRTAFFLAKTLLGLACVFTACLEWSRSSSAILFGNFDPATGPFLLWLYILGTMGVLFTAVVDQKARCRECLQLLAFPVRMGSPGSMLLDWSGIELCCGAGHGVLHVPHLAPSWAEESDHWIALDDSWQGIFGRDKHIS